MGFVRPNTPEAARFRQQVERANRRYGGAEVCHGCKRKLKSGELEYIGLARKRGHLMVVAGCCQHLLKILVGFGVWHSAADTPAEWLDVIPPRGRA
jgi:hypothetical protein